MFRDLSPYPNLASSGPAWARGLPAHWQVRRGKALFRRLAREVGPDDGVVTCFRDGVVTLRSRRRTTGFTEALQEIGYQGVRSGDLVIHAMDAFAGAVGVSDSDGKCSPVYAVCTPKGGVARYYALVVREMARTQWIAALSRGVRERSTDFRFETLASELLPEPPLDEQVAIVKYLAHAHRRIDRAIAAKRRLGLLIDEQRQAMTRRLLTCTSDGDPANWQYVPAGHLCKITTGVEDSGNAVPDGEYPFYVRGREILRASDYIMDAEAVMTPGDGQGGVGKVFHYFNGKFQAHQRVYIFSDFDGVDGRFFYWHLSSFFRRFALSQSNTVTMESLRLPVLASFPVAVPSLSEQRKIVSRIEAEDARAHAVRLTVQREIELLREFRMRLTSDVVTGQLDVRHIAATLDAAVEPGDVDAPDDDLLDDADEPLEEVDA